MQAKFSTAFVHAPTVNTFLVLRVTIVTLSYGLLVLFVIVDGIRYTDNLNDFFHYLPYAIACYALVRTINTTMRHGELFKTAFFFIGLFVFASLA